MSSIIPLSTLAELLAGHAEIPVESASGFIRAYFDAIEQSLSADTNLSVPGLGTFKIEDEETVAFTPVQEFASRVNEAYEIFPSIELDADLDIETIVEPITIPEPTPETEHEPEPEPEPEHEPEPTPDEPEAIVVDEPVEQTVETQPENEIQPEPTEVDESEENIEQAEEEQFAYEEPVVFDNDEKRCCTALYIILTALIALIVGIVIGYLGRHRIEAFVSSSGEQGKHPETVDTIVTDDTDENIETIEIDTTPVNLTEADIAEINGPETETEFDDPTVPKPTVRYDTVTGKRFLTTMAREYFGHQDYWSYIYMANKGILKHPDRIRPGTRVVIPDFETYKTSDDPEKNRTDARRKGVEIYNTFK